MKLREFLDKIYEKQHEMSVCQAKMTESLEHHIKRTDLLEKHWEHLEGRVLKTEKFNERLKGFATIGLGIITALGGMLGILYALQKLISFLGP